MTDEESALSLAEELATSDAVTRLATAVWKHPEIGRRLASEPEATLREFGVDLPESLDLVPLGFGRRQGKPVPGFVPFEISMSRCRTVVVIDKATGIPRMETVCFGIAVVPKKVPGGQIG